METALQHFLRNGGTPAQLEAQYFIKGKQHRRYPHLWSFKYDQVRSDMHQRICQEARGSVLDASDNWAYVARAFDKFWNWGEPLAAPIDWAHARVQEKVDGSLCIVYWYDDQWQVATSGTPDASGPVLGGSSLTFADLFWQTARAMGLEFYGGTTGDTWLFELTTPQNRIVVQHATAHLTLIGCRQTHNGLEIPVSHAARQIQGVPAVQEFPLTDWDAVLASFATMRPLEQEGYVIVSYAKEQPGAQFPRVKVKHPGYVALHHLKDRFTPRGLVEVARQGETAEVLAAFPELSALTAIQARYDALCAEITADWERARQLTTASRKEFAQYASQSRCPAALFALLDARTPDARTFLQTMQIDRLVRLLDVPSNDLALSTLEE